MINDGTIKAIKGEIKTIKQKSVVLKDGKELPCDVIPRLGW